MHFDFYYGAEAGQFAFFRIPQLLIKDKRFKCLSTDAKLLYGLMLDRMTLSMKNGWLDAQNRAYIYCKRLCTGTYHFLATYQITDTYHLFISQCPYRFPPTRVTTPLSFSLSIFLCKER